MVNNVGSPLMVFAVWIFGGMLSLFGALSYAELAAAIPEAGGEYVYLREAYGPLWGFLYGWTQMWVAKSGSIATLATGFFIYLANFRPELEQVWMVVPLPLGEGGSPLPIRYGQLLAMAVIALLALINYFGVKVGGNVQVAATLLKVGLIAGDYRHRSGIGTREHRELSALPSRRRAELRAFLRRWWRRYGPTTAGITSAWWPLRSESRSAIFRWR